MSDAAPCTQLGLVVQPETRKMLARNENAGVRNAARVWRVCDSRSSKLGCLSCYFAEEPMQSIHARVPGRVAIVAVVAASWLMLCGFRPFTPVTTVCPTCIEKGDKITLTDGRTVLADVVAKNQDGYILSKFGELRFVQFPEISKVDYAGRSEPKGLDSYDQILIKNKEQTVLHGTLIAIESGKPMALKSPKGQVYLVLPPQALVYYQRGQRKSPPVPVQP